MKKLTIYFLLVFSILSIPGLGQTHAYYRSKQITDTWNKVGTWQYSDDGTNFTDCTGTDFPGYNNSNITKIVRVQSGSVINGDINLPGGTGAQLIIDGTLDMGGYYIRGTGTQSSRFPSVTVNGNLITSSYVNSTNFTVSSTGKFITAYSGNRGWWYSIYNPTAGTISGEVEFNGTFSQSIPGLSFNNIVLSGGSKLMYGDVTVGGLLTIKTGAIFYLSGSILSIGGGGILVDGTLDGNGSFLNFDGGTQSISGNGSFGEPFEEINIGASNASYVTLSNPNILSTYNLSISSGTSSTFTLGVNSKVSVNTSLVTGNGLLLKASLTDPLTCASLIIAENATVDGNVQSEIYLPGGGNVDDNNFKWHYISTPVSTVSTSVLTGTTNDLAQYVESFPTLDPIQGWVAYDGYVYSTGLSNGPTFSGLSPGIGYNFWDNINNTFILSGTPNITDVNVNLGFSGNASLSGWNLLGNPFSSGLDWDQIINGGGFPLSTSKSLYFTRDNILCYYIGGVGVPGDVNGIIPPMQGFFTKTYSTGNTISFAASARTHNNIHPRYKGSADIPLVRLLLKRNNSVNDETVIRFDNLAKSDFDYDFDAYKLFISAKSTIIYSSVGGTNYAINGLPFPETFTEIPLVVNITKDSVHTISATQLQGLENYNVTLKDNTSGVTTNLKTTPVVSFTASQGTITGRFVLKVSAITTGVEQLLVSDNKFNIFSGDNLIRIRTISDEWDGKSGSIKVLDLAGKTVYSLPETDFSRDSEINIPCTGGAGIYFVEIKSGLKRYVGKVIVR